MSASIRIDVRLVNHDALLDQVGPLERHLVEQLLHHRVQPARADVLGALVDDAWRIGDPLRSASSVKTSVDALRLHQRHVLLDERAARFGENADELVLAERLELDANRETALQFRDEVRRLRDVKRAGRDEEDVIGPHHAVLRVDGRAFDDRQDVALHALAADVRAVPAFASGDLVDLVDEDDAGLLDALDRRRAPRCPCRSASAPLPA